MSREREYTCLYNSAFFQFTGREEMKMNVVLVAINAKYIHSNLAVRSLRAYAKEYQDQIRIAEYTINQQTDEILMDLYKRKPELLCFSCYIWNIEYVEHLLRQFHQVCPDVPIWLGGPEVSYDAKEVLSRLPEVTGVMCGEGEQTFAELLEYYHGKKRELADIKGITYRDCDGNIYANAWRSVMDMNDLPFVYQDMKEFEHRIIYYESSRGCPFSCSYCLSSVDKALRFRDVETVCKELQVFIDAEVPQVKFVDRTFNCDHKHAMAIWRYLLEHDRGKTNFHFEISADLLRDEELELLSRMRPGLVQFEIGVQSTNPHTIQEIHRTMRFDKVAERVAKIKSFGNIHQHLDLIAGLPGEDLVSFARSFDEVYHIEPDQLQLGFLKVLKGSYMEEHKEEYGLVYRARPPYEVLYTKWLSFEDMTCLKQVEEMVEIYYNSDQFTYTLKRLVEAYDSPFQFYRQLGSYYERHQLHMCSHSRVSRYDILLDFICEYHLEEKELYVQLLTLDYFLRENGKNRPAFAGEDRVDKELARYFYEKESDAPEYLVGYGAYDKRQLRKMTHLESFTYDVMGNCEPLEQTLLFDYQNRDILTYQARVFRIQ